MSTSNASYVSELSPASDAETNEASTASSSEKPGLKERISKKYLARFNARRRIGTPFKKVPENLHRVANQLSLGLELVEDFRSGRYRSISWGSLAILTGAFLYSVSPADVLPDALLGLGSIDDAIVLALATRWLRPELEKYCAFKGYAVSDYFGSAVPRPLDPRKAPPVVVDAVDVPA